MQTISASSWRIQADIFYTGHIPELFLLLQIKNECYHVTLCYPRKVWIEWEVGLDVRVSITIWISLFFQSFPQIQALYQQYIECSIKINVNVSNFSIFLLINQIRKSICNYRISNNFKSRFKKINKKLCLLDILKVFIFEQ